MNCTKMSCANGIDNQVCVEWSRVGGGPEPHTWNGRPTTTVGVEEPVIGAQTPVEWKGPYPTPKDMVVQYKRKCQGTWNVREHVLRKMCGWLRSWEPGPCQRRQGSPGRAPEGGAWGCERVLHEWRSGVGWTAHKVIFPVLCMCGCGWSGVCCVW